LKEEGRVALERQQKGGRTMTRRMRVTVGVIIPAVFVILSALLLYCTAYPPGYREFKREVKLGMKKTEVERLLDKNGIQARRIVDYPNIDKSLGITGTHSSEVFLIIPCTFYLDFFFNDSDQLVDYVIDVDGGL
jgi:hypothetical protein